MPAKKTTNSIQDFEGSLEKLNTLIAEMENGNLSLEESLAHFETGISLIKSCQKVLSKAEQKVQKLTRNDD